MSDFIERAAAAEWDRSAELRAEFGRYETYLAYCKASRGAALARTHGPAPAILQPDSQASKGAGPVFDLVASQPWAILPDMLEGLCSAANGYTAAKALEAKAGIPLQGTHGASMRGSVAVVPVIGPIFRYTNLFSQLFGMPALDKLAMDFSAAVANPSVSAIVLNIDSPGGQVAGTAEFAAMVRGSNKPVIAYVGGMGASAAYWIASAAREIVASRTAMVGGIGVVLGVDARKDPSRVEIVSSQSPNKRPDVTTEQGRNQIQTMIDAMAQVFIDDVAAYRGVSASAVQSKFGKGDILLGAEAVKAGMVNRTGTLEAVINQLNGKGK